ncbi:MAG TPA: TonB-dependent receptor [Gemmatimonadaceae bacterium]|nr:TonB-dependent receptor [Gemmatimonadaceae bacterium]
MRLHVLPTLAAAAVLLDAAVTPVRAQQAADTATLNPVVITATRVAVPQNAASASVTVLRGEDLRARGISTVAQALRSVPGVEVAQGGSFGATSSLFLRGGESDYVKVLVDGVPVNDPGGAFDFANLTTQNIDRIEIVRGPASVLYGSDAVTGVIQIFTRRGEDAPPRLAAGMRGGTYGTREYEGTLAGGSARVSYTAGVVRHTTQGILPFNNQYRDNSYSGLLRYASPHGSSVQLSTRYTDGDFHYPTNGAGVPDDSNAFRTERRFVTALHAGHFFTPHLEGRVQLGATAIRARSDDRPDNTGDTLGVFGYLASGTLDRRSADARINAYLTPATVFTAGAAYSWQHDATSSETLIQGGSAPTPPFDQARENLAYYAQLIGNVGRRLSYTAGGRLDDNQQFGRFTTYRLGVGARLDRATRVHAALGNSFKEPTFDEQFSTAYTEGNAGLRPEQSRSWELGVERQLMGGRLILGATYFDQHFRDLVQYAATPQGTPDYFNVAAANASGAELELRAALTNALGVTANYTYLRTRVINAGFDSTADATFVTGNRLLRRPTNLANLDVRYRFPSNASIAMAVNYTGGRDDRDFSAFPAVPVLLDAYTKVDLSGELPIVRGTGTGGRIALTARIDNLFDAQYRGAFGFRVPGRVMLLGVRAGIGL